MHQARLSVIAIVVSVLARVILSASAKAGNYRLESYHSRLACKTLSIDS